MIKRIKGSLTAKLFGVTCLLLMVACAVTYLVIALSLPKSYTITVTDNLQEELKTLSEQLSGMPIEDSGDLLRSFQLQTGTTLTVVDDQGQEVEITGMSVDVPIVYNGTFVSVAVVEDKAAEDTDTVYYASEKDIAVDAVEAVEGTAGQTLVQDVRFADGGEAYVLSMAVDSQAWSLAEQALGNLLPVLALAVIVVSLLGSLLISRFVTRPIVRLSAVSKRLSALDFSWEIKGGRTDEIGVLAQSLQSLSTHLGDALDDLKAQVAREKDLQRQQSAFFSAVSHELKTPLTVIRGQLEGMIAGIGVYADRDLYLDKTLDEAKRMSGMVQQILDIFRMGREDFVVAMEPVDLPGLIDASLSAHAGLLAQREMAVEVQVPEGLTMHGNGATLSQALGNLLSNAAQYSPPGAQVRICAAQEGDKVRLTIENTGVSIPEEAIPRLFDAFFRVEGSRNRASGGSGLGLHIVRTILDQHGADYGIENTAAGVRFTVLLAADHTQTTQNEQ